LPLYACVAALCRLQLAMLIAMQAAEHLLSCFGFLLHHCCAAATLPIAGVLLLLNQLLQHSRHMLVLLLVLAAVARTSFQTDRQHS
jgi:hypothetical protein